MMLKQMNDVFTDIDQTGGIFTGLNNYAVPWQAENISHWLDIAYHIEHSGEKLISPLVLSALKHADAETATSTVLDRLARTVYTIYHDKWAKEYATLTAEYNPIENYDMVEQMSNDNRNTTKSGSSNITGTGETNTTQSGTLTNNIYGFNSSESSPSDTTTNSSTIANSSESSGTETTSETIADTHSYTLRRSGNIGVTTSQQMLQSERDLWQWSYFEDIIFPDIDKWLTLAIY